MRRRYLLGAGGAAIGGIWLLQYLPERSQANSRVEAKFEINKTEDEWRKILTRQQYDVLRREGTEAPGSSPLLKEYRVGNFACAGCNLPLFSSETKYESGTGWPSFYASIENAIATRRDGFRLEVHCRRCGGHLGHVFDDGPQPTGQRYCMNGAALKFIAG